jgi:hypothetical protein
MSTDETNPAAMEYMITHTNRLTTPGRPPLARIWGKKYADVLTDWDQINSLGADGWEMVNAFPVESGGSPRDLAFVFKRPMPPGARPTRGRRTPEATAPPDNPPDGLPILWPR